jgi:hypothetical protein
LNHRQRAGTASERIADGHSDTTLPKIKGHEGKTPTGRVMHARQPPRNVAGRHLRA